jgi:hypothetical protein
VVQRRLLSWFWDYLISLCVLGGAFVVVGVPSLLGWFRLQSVWDNPVGTDVAITLLTVVPFLAYLVVREVADDHATWGKAREHLIVRDLRHAPESRNGFVVRNVIKVLPWQFGHMGAVRLARDAAPSGIAFVYVAVSLFLASAIAGPPLMARRGLHDLVAGTTVARTRGP